MLDLPNPFQYLAGKAVGELVADAWTSIMLAIWMGGYAFMALRKPNLKIDG